MSGSDDKPDEGWTKFHDGQVIDSPASTRERAWGPRLIIAGVALLAAVLFVVQNNNRVSFDFLVFNFRARLWVVILVNLLLGALLGQAIGLLRRRRKKDD